MLDVPTPPAVVGYCEKDLETHRGLGICTPLNQLGEVPMVAIAWHLARARRPVLQRDATNAEPDHGQPAVQARDDGYHMSRPA